MNLITISGGSSSGKTTLANKIKNVLGHDQVEVIRLDDYYYEKFHFTNKDEINWDDLNSFNLDLLEKHLNMLKQGKQVSKEKFLYGPNIYGDIKIIRPKKYVILEGIFSNSIPFIFNYSTLSFFLDSRNEVRLDRRINRDKNLIPNFSKQKLIETWEKFVIPAFNENIYPTIKKVDYVINTNEIEKKSNEIINNVINKLVKLNK